MAVRTKHLARAVSTLTLTTIYTVPAGETAIVKYITVQNSLGVGGVVCFLNAIFPSGAALVFRETLAAPDVDRFDTWLVLPPTTQLQLSSSILGLVVTLSGTELEGVAD